MSHIRAVAFDFGGTLYDLVMNETDTIAYERSLFMALGQFATIWPLDDAITQKQTIEAISSLEPEQLAKVSRINNSPVGAAPESDDYREHDALQVVAAQLAQVGVHLTQRALNAYIARETMLRYIQAFTEPSVTDTLVALSDKGYTLGVISNWTTPPEVARNAFATLGLDSYFDPNLVLFSCEAGWRKPSPRIFRSWLEKAGSPDPASCVFVGDRLVPDIWGAQQLGMHAVLSTQYFTDDPDQTAPDGKQITPDGKIASLDELPALLERLASD